jgi:hypothetical protein
VLLPSLDQLGSVFLTPPFFVLDVLSVEQLSLASTLVTKNDDANTPPVKVTGSEGADAIQAARPKINNVSGRFWKRSGKVPMNGGREDLVAQRPRERTLHLPNVRT